MTLGGFTENPSVLSSAQGSEVGQGEGEALLFSLSLESLVLVSPSGAEDPFTPSFNHHSSDVIY